MTDRRTEGQTDAQMDGRDCNIPDAFLKKRGDNKCVLLKDHNTVTLVKLKPAASLSRVKHSTTVLLLSDVVFIMLINVKMPTIVGILTFMS